MKRTLTILIVCILCLGCEKQNRWLDVKSNKTDVIPTTISDLQALLDNTAVMNTNSPVLGMIGTDNFYLLDVTALTGGNLHERNAYKWASDIYEGNLNLGYDWVNSYKAIAYANTVLEGLEKLPVSEQIIPEWKLAKGSALFFRAFYYYALAELYMRPYDRITASTDPGVPIKLTADVNEKIDRSTVQNCYNLIIDDLSKSLELLPVTPQFKTRPSKGGAYGLLARTLLNMEDYAGALKYADEALKLNSNLLQFSNISATPVYPFPTYQTGNAEILFYSDTNSYTFISLSSIFVTESLYLSYQANDIRRSLFFRINADGTKSFRGRYSGGNDPFSGIATNELFLIKAESLARAGKINDSMDVLNKLLITRWAIGTYAPYTATNENTALAIILNERNKELPFTGNLRWTDLKRLNKDSRFARTLTRIIGAQTYTLPPNDIRYALPLIPEEILRSNLPQNPR